MAQDPPDFQADAATAGEVQVNQARFGAQGEEHEQPVPFAWVESPPLYHLHIIDAQAAKVAFEIAAGSLHRRLPAKSVRHQDEALLLGEPRDLADSDEGVLQDRRKDA